jgi:tetratricopeptide (TPR) repeat protein
LRLCSSSSFARESLAYRARFGGLQLQAGTWLNRLYKLTNNKEHLRKAAKALAEAAESFQKVDLKSRIAECHWKAAQTYDAYEEHLKAADSFSLASNSYKSAAESIPQLEDFYQDHARYMEAWSEIERAKYHHKRQEYGKAKESYEKSANLHESTERWSYIAPNYLAWARLEEAEGLSRTEKPEEAKDLFQQAVELFLEAKKSIQAKLETIEAGEEKQVAAELAEASDTRREYCLGRIAVEEAKILDRHGDHAASSRKYGAAAETFQEIIDSMDELGRRELKPIVCLSRAWQMMTQAEAEASPSLYLEASRFFDEAKEHSLDERAKILSLGHSCFCKALEAGTRFEASRDAKLFSTAKRHIEAATNYYLKTGFKTASDYAKATYRLLDAYIYTGKAQTEMNPGKKAQFYQMAERLLEASAGSYMKAKHSEKSEDVRRLLESVKEERQIIMSLNEVLHAPTISSSATSFASPTPTHEQAVGLERFEHAFVEANLMVSEKVTAGEKVEVGLDLVNVARNSGLLVRVDNLVPSGFKVTTLPSQYNMENGTVDLRGRRLEPLKVESFKLALRATRVGVFSLAPRVTYVDDLGKFKTCEPKPVSVTVHPRLAFEFKTKAAQKVFDYLTKSFVEDYMRRRLALEKSGWRTLMQIIKHGKVSKSSVYGAGGHRGPAVSELERRGLAEARVFPGERGRGGRILKMRIAYERETIKRHLDQKVMKIKEK